MINLHDSDSKPDFFSFGDVWEDDTISAEQLLDRLDNFNRTKEFQKRLLYGTKAINKTTSKKADGEVESKPKPRFFPRNKGRFDKGKPDKGKDSSAKPNDKKPNNKYVYKNKVYNITPLSKDSYWLEPELSDKVDEDEPEEVSKSSTETESDRPDEEEVYTTDYKDLAAVIGEKLKTTAETNFL